MTQLTLFDPIEVPLTQGLIALIDPIDVDLLEVKWTASFNHGRFRAQRNLYRHGAPRKTVFMHRIIMSRVVGRSILPQEQVDHIDLNPLNNRRNNLRLASASENQRNTGRQTNNTSGFKGVSIHRDKWRALIRVNGKSVWLGLFDTPELAHEAYKAAALEYHGEFARFK